MVGDPRQPAGMRPARSCTASVDDAHQVAEVQKRALAVSMAGVFATARERGVDPEHEALAEEVVRLANENGKANTALHYAYKLVDILERISKRTWVFDAPPIVGRAEPQTVARLCRASGCSRCRLPCQVSVSEVVPKDSGQRTILPGEVGVSL